MAPLSPRDSTDPRSPQDTPAPIVAPAPTEEAAPLHLHTANILDNISDAVVALGRDWRILYANRAACRINQKPPEEFVGKMHWEEWPAAVGTELERHLRRAMDERVEVHFEHRYVSGPYDVWVEADVYPSDEGINLFYRDITGRKQAQEELGRSEQRYRSLVEATAEIVWTNSPDGEMRGPQPGWGAFTGQPEAEYQGFGWARAVHPEDAQPTVDAWNKAVAARRPFLFEHRVRRHDGVYRTFAIRAVAILDEAGAIREWVGIHTDVTERREMEAAREALRANPSSAAAWGSVGWFLYESGSIPEAITDDQRALSLDGSQDWVRYNLGLAYAVQGDWPRAQAAYSAAIRQATHVEWSGAVGEVHQALARQPQSQALQDAGMLLRSHPVTVMPRVCSDP